MTELHSKRRGDPRRPRGFAIISGLDCIVLKSSMTSLRELFTWRRGACGLALLLLTLQGLPLFWSKPFYVDWTNHVWTVSYFADYFRLHSAFPDTVNVVQEFGNPMPSFYGVFFYPLLALLSLPLGPDLAMRLFCGGLLAAPLLVYMRYLEAVTKDRVLSILLAVIINSSVYQLTNLYQRSALTEFAALQCLMIALPFLLYGLTSRSRKGSASLFFGFASVALCLGIHPITFYLSALFAGPAVIGLVLATRRNIFTPRLYQAAIWSACAVALLSPWVYATLKYGSELYVANDGRFSYWPGSVDSFWGKVGLAYTDTRVLVEGIGATSTPFAAAPFSLATLIAAATLFGLLNKSEGYRFIRVELLLAAPLLAIIFFSITPQGGSAGGVFGQVEFTAESNWMFRLLAPTQFAYRMSGTFALCSTLALLVGVFLCLGTGENRLPGRRSFTVFALFAALFGTQSAGQKLLETYTEYYVYPSAIAERQGAPLPNDRILSLTPREYGDMIADTTSYPATFYSSGAYAMLNRFAVASDEFANGRQLQVRITDYDLPVAVNCESACVLRTNVVPSAFLTVLLDDQVPRRIAMSDEARVVVAIGPGEHQIRVLRRGRIPQFIAYSIWAALAWIAVACISLIFAFFSSQKGE